MWQGWEQVAEVVKKRAPAGLGRHLEAVLQLEATAIWQAYGDTSAAGASLEAAAAVLGLSVRLSGTAPAPFPFCLVSSVTGFC